MRAVPINGEPTTPTKGERLVALHGSGLYLLFDPRTRPNRWQQLLVDLFAAGVRWFQLRAKGAGDDQLRFWLQWTRRELGRAATLILNDRPLVDAPELFDGVHLGPDDPSPRTVRQQVGDSHLIGASGDTRDRLAGDAAAEVDYFGIGTVHPTGTKRDAGRVLGFAGLARAIGLAAAPAVAIGGLQPEDAGGVAAAGAWGMAVYGGVWEAEDPVLAARCYLAQWQSVSNAEKVGNDE